MAGNGVMSHAIQSLKMNRRDKVNFLSSEEQVLYHYSEDTFVSEEASAQRVQEIEAKIEQLKQAEAKRVTLAIGIVVVLILAVLFWFL
ncbi:MAG: hypothetical protein ACRBFS_18570 [Aureispira sp.]